MADIIRHNFGKEDRDHLRRIGDLKALLAKYETDVLADPLPYLRDASKAICDLKAEIFSIWEIVAKAHGPITAYGVGELPPPPAMDLHVDAREYEALQQAYRRIAVLAGMRAAE